MTIDEVIASYEKNAERYHKAFLHCKAHGGEFYQSEAESNRICEEHDRQLATWLKELLEYKSQPKIIYCKDCKKRNFAGYCTVHQKNVHGLTAEFWQPEDDYFCADGERKTDGNNT